MLRSFIPFLLVSLGLTMILWADRMPLFEWKISEIVTDFSSACDANLPTYWSTRFGESLDASDDLENLSFVVRRSPKDESLDRVSLAFDSWLASWLYQWSLVEVIISITYLWWFLLRDKQNRASQLGIAASFTVIAIFVCFLLGQVLRFVAPPLVHGIPYYSVWDCQGTITFRASILKIHYETPAIRFAGILLQLGALGVILCSMLKAIIPKESSKSAVG